MNSLLDNYGVIQLIFRCESKVISKSNDMYTNLDRASALILFLLLNTTDSFINGKGLLGLQL
jgi:hypothetical protein